MKVAIKPNLDFSALHLSPEEEMIMKQCAQSSARVWTGWMDDEVACVWGVVSPTLMSDQAYLWLYTNKPVDEHQFTFVRHSQRVIEELLKTHSQIIGVCAVGASQSRRWLKWLGATFGESEDGKYLPFTIRRK